MKTIRYFILMVAASALGACSNENILGSGYDNDPSAVVLKAEVGPITTTSRSNPLGQTGEATTAFQNGDAVAVSNDDGLAFSTYIFDSNAGAWTPESSDKYLTWDASYLMSFKAYYPAGKNNASMTSFTIPVNQTEYHTGTANDIALADYMTAEGQYSKPEQTNAVTLAFTRHTARVIVKIDQIRNELGTTPPTIENVRIKGQINMGGTISDVTSFAQEVAGVKGSTYTALLLPTNQDSKAIFITLTVNGKELTVTGIPTLEAGKSYNFNLSVGHDGLFISNVSVTPWDETTLASQGTTKSVEYDAVNHSITVNEMGGLFKSSKEGSQFKPYFLIDKALNGTHILHVYGTINDTDLNTLLNATNAKVLDLRHTTLVNCKYIYLGYYNDEKYIIFTPEQVLLSSINIVTWKENNNYNGHILFVGRNLDYGIKYQNGSGFEDYGHTLKSGYVLSISDDAKSYTLVVKVTDAKTYADAVDYATKYKPSSSRLIRSSDNFISAYTNALATDIYSTATGFTTFKDYLAGNSYWFDGTSNGTTSSLYLYDSTNKSFSNSVDNVGKTHESLVVITNTLE